MILTQGLFHIWQYIYYITYNLHSTVHNKTCCLTLVYDKNQIISLAIFNYTQYIDTQYTSKVHDVRLLQLQ